MKPSDLKTIVCLPAFNEIDSIELMIDSIGSEGFEVLITDGGSTDGTLQKAHQKSVVVLERAGMGKGYGMCQAIKFSEGQKYHVIVFMDCDMTYPANRIPDLVKEIENYDMVVGARKMASIKILNRIANYIFTGLINFLYNVDLKDTQSGMRAMRISRYTNLITASTFDAESEITCKSLRGNYRLKEIEIDYYDRVGDRKVRFLDAFAIIFRIIKCWF